MGFVNCVNTQTAILMEGALGERLKREYHLLFDDHVAMAALATKQDGIFALKTLWHEYIAIAEKYQLPFLATTPTRRANKERMALAGYDSTLFAENVNLLRRLQQDCNIEMYVGGLMGCKGDAYSGDKALSEKDAYQFHTWQAEQLHLAGVDFLFAGIMPNISEAAGMALAMAATKLPYIISFTIEKNGCLMDGTTIADAIKYIDSIASMKPVCYMTNCVHPSLLYAALSQPFNNNQLVRTRFLGIQANTSPLPYSELDGSVELKCSEPVEFADEMIKLRDNNGLKIFGGCCGTDNRHMESMAQLLK